MTAPIKLRGDSNSTSNSAPSVAFVIPARNEALHLKRCIDSINSQKHRKDAPTSIGIVVVDNESTDRTAEIARECGATVLQVPPGNAGRARNKGVAATKQEYVAFVDADCVLPAEWLTTCLEHMTNSNVAAVGAPQAPAPENATWIERVWVDTITHASQQEWKTTDWLPAFNPLIRRTDFVAVGCFDESLETCEDSDLSFKLSKAGQLRTVLTPRVLHLGESQTLTEFFKREKWRSHGNFRSAIKRGEVRKEFLSLFIPLSFSVAIAGVIILATVSPILNRRANFAAMTLICLVASVPVGIAFLKKGKHHLFQRSILIFVYLIARGLGPLTASRRVERKKEKPAPST